MSKYISSSKKVALTLVFLLIFAKSIVALDYPGNLWKGLIGEAVSEGHQGMYAVGCVYRNRLKKGMNLGCVALKRKSLDNFVRRQGKKYAIMAQGIVQELFENDGKDITGGATHYENTKVFGIPRWVKKMKITCKIGSHTFYKEVWK